MTRHIPSIAFYIGGFEKIGGIEASFQDLALALSGHPVEPSFFVWADDLPELKAIAQSGARVFRTGLRYGCRYGWPDWALFMKHGHRLRNAQKVVFGKLPPPAIFNRIVAMLDRRPGGRPELLYVTAYRPSESWADGLPSAVRDLIDTIIVQSADFTVDLRTMGYEGRIVEIPYLPPAAAAFPVLRYRKGNVRLGFLGRLAPQKNLFYLLDIIELLRGEPIELHMFGEGEQGERLRAEVAARDLPVTFHGPVPRNQVPSAIEEADIFVNPSLSEGQCLVALEVLSRGRPFLASAVGAIPQILSKGDFGRIVPLENTLGAANVIREFVKDWRAGRWEPSEVVAQYQRAYKPATILGQYIKLFEDGVETI